MTQEEKSLLLKAICAGLPYGIKCTTKLTGYNDVYVIQGVYEDNVFIDCPVYEEGDNEWMIESIILFLRPMSSMTEEECEYYDGIRRYLVRDDWEVVDWLNEHHFDYRGLIEKGLALEAPKDMYNTKTE